MSTHQQMDNGHQQMDNGETVSDCQERSGQSYVARFARTVTITFTLSVQTNISNH